jgi:outer membrane protein insertion porin family
MNKKFPPAARTGLLALIILFSFLSPVQAQEERVRVMVLPFEVHSQQPLSYMKTRIPEVIRGHLRDEGAVIVDPPEIIAGRSQSEIQQMGLRQGADYVIWGSLTWIGETFSVDAKMIDIYGGKPLSTFYVEGKSIENLPLIVKELSSEFGMALFEREPVVQILIEGNDRIEDDAIRRVIQTEPGDVYLPKALSEDLRAIWSMGYFDDVRAETRDAPGGRVVIYRVDEKPTIRYIRILKNRVFDDEEIRENISLNTGSILNIFAVENNVERIESFYEENNYHNVSVDYRVERLENNQADLELIIDEGSKVHIKSIAFQGNDAYPDKRLKKLMKTSEKGFFSWLTSSGDLNPEDLNQDAARITSFYHNNGYIQARVSDPQVRYEGEWIYITIKIEEGPRFEVGQVDIEGDEITSETPLMDAVEINEKEYYSRDTVRKDVLALTDIYADAGYAYAEVSPMIRQNPDDLTVDITYGIDKGKPVYFEKIIISGNVKTRDKVIRRQLKVIEKERYSGKRLKRSIRDLQRLDYFEDVNVNTIRGSGDDQMILKIDVSEKPTGTFSFGGGYSSVENLFAMASISQRNLFGRGQVVQLKAEVGGTTSRYTFSFTEPWLFDIPLSAGFDLYNWDRDYNTYDKNSTGGGVRFGYPVADYTRVYLSYSYEIADITNITEEAADIVKELSGENVTSAVSTTLRYDSRDRQFNPTEGGDHSLSVEYAGLGGDIGFTKYIGEVGQYFPLFWGTVGFIHGRAGYVDENSNGTLPDYERFYLGGMNSLRGFDWRDISSYDENGDQIGGTKFVQTNIEYLIPLVKEAGVVGVLFFDAGNVYDEDEDLDLGVTRESAGFGFRWYSPMGPIRIENGYILDPREGEDSGGRWEFSMGSAF